MADNEQDTSLEGAAGAGTNNLVTPGPVGGVPASPVQAPPTIPNAPIQPTPTPNSTPAPTASSAPPPTPKPARPNFIRNLLARVNVYFLVFILLVIVAGGIIALSIKTSKGNGSNNQVGSLTSDQIANLKGSTTVVGSNKQTLDVQSDSIFEGQVLARNSLDVAGNIKVGGSVSLPVLNVTNQTTLAGLQVGQNLNVAGSADIQGQLTLHKGLTVQGSTSFGNLSAATLSVTSLQLNGDLGLNRHIVTSGDTPAKSTGSALGSGGTASVSGNDTAGTVNINIGSSPAAGIFINITFVHAFSSTPHVLVTPIGFSAAGLQYYVTRSTSGFSIGTANPPTAGTNFAFDYWVIQ